MLPRRPLPFRPIAQDGPTMPDQTTQEPQDLHDDLLRVVSAANRRCSRMAQLLDVTGTDMVTIEQLSSRGEMSPTRLADILDLSSGGMAIVIKRLERAGHVVRRPHPVDGRRTLVVLSDATARRYRELTDKLARELEDEVTRTSPALRAQMRRLLREVAEAFEAQAEQLATDAAEAAPVTPLPRVPSLWQ
jgi:MarR family multiple antibiotic resistance transcriptional regulator